MKSTTIELFFCFCKIGSSWISENPFLKKKKKASVVQKKILMDVNSYKFSFFISCVFLKGCNNTAMHGTWQLTLNMINVLWCEFIFIDKCDINFAYHDRFDVLKMILQRTSLCEMFDFWGILCFCWSIILYYKLFISYNFIDRILSFIVDAERVNFHCSYRFYFFSCARVPGHSSEFVGFFGFFFTSFYVLFHIYKYQIKHNLFCTIS